MYSKSTKRKLVIGMTTTIAVCQLSIAFAAPTPDFAVGGSEPPTNVAVDVKPGEGEPPTNVAVDVKPQVVHKTPTPVKSKQQTNQDIPLPDFSPGTGVPNIPDGSEDPSGGYVSPQNESGIFKGVTPKDIKFINELKDRRERIILDTMQKRIDSLEGSMGPGGPPGSGGMFSMLPPGKPEVLKAPVVESPHKTGPKNHGIKVLGIHDDRIFVDYQGHKTWYILGDSVGPYRIKGISESTATFVGKKGESFTVKKSPKVIPRPEIAVVSVNGQTASIKYKGDAYTVTLNSPVGDDLTVTALSSDNFSVTDSHGRVFSYPVPVPTVATPGGPTGRGGPMSMPPPGYSPQPQGLNFGAPQAGSPEDSNY